MTGEQAKICKGCGESKALSLFHKHKQMVDGHLNFCKSCFYAKSKARRLANPEQRKEEYKRLSERLGRMTRQEYNEKRIKNGKGRKVSSNLYAQKRRARLESSPMSELDVFVVEEAYRLREVRKLVTKFDWHVDHIVPLNHKKACGLHNAHNLQVVPAVWNLTKSHSNMDKYLGV